MVYSNTTYTVDTLGRHPAKVFWRSVVQDCLDTNKVPLLHQEIMHSLGDKQMRISNSPEDGLKSVKNNNKQ